MSGAHGLRNPQQDVASKPNGALTDVYLAELSTLYDAEIQALRVLPRLRDAARSLKLREALARHCDETRLHIERLQLIFTHWGAQADAGHSAGLAGIVQEADERLHDGATDDARDAIVIGVAQRLEHYEIAGYGCARIFARRLNRPDEARLLLETLEEEGRAARRISEVAESQAELDLTGAMVEVRPGSHIATPPHGDKLR
jgi:ferritin-like metal-binding protein YciE